MFRCTISQGISTAVQLCRKCQYGNIKALQTASQHFNPQKGNVSLNGLTRAVHVLQSKTIVCTSLNSSRRQPPKVSVSTVTAAKDDPNDTEIKDSEDWSENHEVVGAFDKYPISQPVVDKLKDMGIQYLFPVQYKTLSALINGEDVIVQARTGTGKTLSFAIPLVDKLQQIGDRLRGRPPKVLVLAPTRELAQQVADNFTAISSSVRVLAVYGGTSYHKQERGLRDGVDVLVGTPGRIMDWLERGLLKLNALEHVVLDEVDLMLDMGFADDVEKILRNRYRKGDVSSNPQTLLFSATMPKWVAATAKKYLRQDYKVIDLIGRDKVKAATTVKHLAIQCPSWQRATLLQHVINQYSDADGRVIVFCQTKKAADYFARTVKMGRRVAALHGDVSQSRRENVLSSFRDGYIQCLVATDVAARGLDIPEVDLVVQMSPPQDLDMYIHRSGRTGRAGRDGTALLLYGPDEEMALKSMQQRAGIRFQKIDAPETEELKEQLTKSIQRNIARVPEASIRRYENVAEQLIAQYGPVHSVAAAIALSTNGPEEMQTRNPKKYEDPQNRYRSRRSSFGSDPDGFTVHSRKRTHFTGSRPRSSSWYEEHDDDDDNEHSMERPGGRKTYYKDWKKWGDR